MQAELFFSFFSVFKVLLLDISKTYSDSDYWKTNLRVSPFKWDQHHAYHPNGSRTACNLLWVCSECCYSKLAMCRLKSLLTVSLHTVFLLFGLCSHNRRIQLYADETYAFEWLSRYFDILHWPFCAAPLKVECAYWLDLTALLSVHVTE